MTFRSKDMGHYQIIIPRQSAYNVINQFAMYDIAHIIDNGDLLNRHFYPQIKRCQQSLVKVDSIIEKLKQEKIQFEEYDQNQKLFIQKLYFLWNQQQRRLGIMPIKMLDKIQQDIHLQYKRFKDIDERLEKIKNNQKEILQKIACYQTIDSFFGQSTYKRESQEYYMNNIGSIQNVTQMSGVSFMVGVIESKSLMRLSKMIYRVSRGYACIKEMSHFQFQPLSAFQQKVVLVIYPSSSTSILQRKIQRVIETFCHNFYVFSRMELNIKASIAKLHKEYQEILDMLELNSKEMKQFLTMIRDIRYLESWRIFLWKEKLIYETLNKFELRQQIICGQLYVPLEKIQNLSLQLARMIPSPTLHQISDGTPPTAFDTNCYTVIAQQITNTYGVPRYKQINPSILTTVTFPFFFGVMFGDIAHGGCLLAFGIYLVFNNEKIKRSSLKIFSQLRYMILMMGFFAFYCGWVYNDFMGMNMNFFGSCYKVQPQPDEEGDVIPVQVTPEEPDCIYPFGIDPVWGRSKNNLQFVNTLKMKISVIIAIIHMTVGVVIKAYNARFFRKSLDFYFEFIPQFIFLVGLFAYMDFLIVFKWLQDWSNRKQWAPSIITTMMNIGLKMGETSTEPDGGSNMWGQRGNTSQDTIQLLILLIAFLCVPIMLLPKPIIQIQKMKKQKQHQNPLSISQDEELDSQMQLSKRLNPSQQNSNSQCSNEHGDVEPNQIFVHQLIETIEYVLGAISNTASYLRLWALSLAHSQLALVFFQKTLEGAYIEDASFVTPPMMVIFFYMIVWITFGILMCMDSMECFLHSLRLHWVEFQNKFYKGDGYRYEPLSFKSYILSKKNVSDL